MRVFHNTSLERLSDILMEKRLQTPSAKCSEKLSMTNPFRKRFVLLKALNRRRNILLKKGVINSSEYRQGMRAVESINDSKVQKIVSSLKKIDTGNLAELERNLAVWFYSTSEGTASYSDVPMLELEASPRVFEEHPQARCRALTHVSIKGLGISRRLKAVHVINKSQRQEVEKMLSNNGFNKVEIKTKVSKQ